MKLGNHLVAIIFALAILAPSLSEAAIRYVKADANGTNNGASWENAYREVVIAINAAQPGDELWIASGIYYPDFDPASGTHTGNRSLRFQLKANVKIFGGFAGTETARTPRNIAVNRTIFSGDIGQPGVFGDNTQSLSYAISDSTGILVEGVVFAGGNASLPDLGNGDIGGSGGGVYLSRTTAEFRHCAFVDNYATYGGGMMVANSGSSFVTLTNCVFAGNRAVYVGGAIDFSAYTGQFTVRNCTITGNSLINSSSRGAAIGTNIQVSCSYFNNVIHGNVGPQKVETGNGSPVTDNNILEAALNPPGSTNFVVASPLLSRMPSAGSDGRWGTMDDILDGALTANSPAVGFASVARMPADSTDLDGDGDINEPMSRDFLDQPRTASGIPDAGAFEFSGNVTLVPLLNAPSQGSVTTRPVNVNYELPEAAAPGTVKLSFENANVTRVLTLSAALEAQGSHDFSFDPANPVGGSVVSGAPIADGVYIVRLSYQDAAGAPIASASHTEIRLDTTGPTGGSMTIFPVNSTLTGGAIASVSFADWTDGGGQTPFTYQLLIDGLPTSEPSQNTLFNFTVPTTPGSHTFTGYVRDKLGNRSEIDVVREVGSFPLITLESPINITKTGATLRATLNSRGLATTVTFYLNNNQSAVVDVPAGLDETMVTAAAGDLIPGSEYSVQAVASNAAGFSLAGPITFRTLENAPSHEVLATTGHVLPNAGTDPRIQSGAVWTQLGVPAISESGDIAYLASWRGPTQSGTGIFLNDQLMVKNGDEVPLTPGARFKSFKDPVIGANEQIVFIATIGGQSVGANNDSVIVSGPDLQVLVRENDVVPGLTTGAFGKFQSVAIPANGTVWFTADLKHGREVAEFSDRGLWMVGSDGLQLIVREGSRLALPAFTQMVKSFRALDLVAGSTGQGRYAAGYAGLLVTFADRSEAILNVHVSSGGIENDVSTGIPLFDGSTSARKFGMPSWLPDGSLAVLAALDEGLPKARSKYAIIVKRGGSGSILARAGQDSSLGAGVTFASFEEPVMASDHASIAFTARMAGSNVNAANNKVVWWSPNDTGELIPLAQTGDQAAECEEGTRWSRFVSLAIPGGNTGPLLLATLGKGDGHVNATNDCGLWGVDSSGALRLLLREGDEIEGKPVKSFNVLEAVPGSKGVTRSFNSNARVVLRITFTDSSSAILKIQVP
jgi:hypothetical protein